MSRKTSGRGSYGVVKAKYIHNRSKKTGRHVTGNVSRLAYYNVYGSKKTNESQQERGPIYNERGERQSYAEYKSWSIGKTVDHKYTYRMIVSPKGHNLSDADFISSLNVAGSETGIGEEYMVVIHRDTANAHGHVLFHRNTVLSKKELEAWKVATRGRMIEIEAKADGNDLKKSDERKRAGATSSEKTSNRKRRKRTRRRAYKKEKGIEL